MNFDRSDLFSVQIAELLIVWLIIRSDSVFNIEVNGAFAITGNMIVHNSLSQNWNRLKFWIYSLVQTYMFMSIPVCDWFMRMFCYIFVGCSVVPPSDTKGMLKLPLKVNIKIFGTASFWNSGSNHAKLSNCDDN